MKTARDRILAKLRAAPVQPPVEPDVAGYYAQHTPPTTLPDRLRQFSRMMRAVHTELHYTHAHGWPTLLARIVRDKNIGSVLLAPRTPHGERAVVALSQLDTAPQLLTFDQPIEAWKDQLFNGVAAAFTGSRAGIADTGALVLWPDAEEPRSMSLVPPIHLVLFEASRLYENHYHAMTAEGWAQGLPTNSLLISGPSKTADIQQTLAYGAHGPRELVVLVLLPDDLTPPRWRCSHEHPRPDPPPHAVV